MPTNRHSRRNRTSSGDRRSRFSARGFDNKRQIQITAIALRNVAAIITLHEKSEIAAQRDQKDSATSAAALR